MSKLSDFGKFLAKYALEVASISDAMRAVLLATSIAADDKARVLDILKTLEENAESVANAALSFKEAKITVRKSDVDAAVASLLPAAIRAELVKAGLVAEIEEPETGDENGNESGDESGENGTA